MADEDALERTIAILEQCKQKLVTDFANDIEALEHAIQDLKSELARKQRPQ